jgi:hypothetical protein
MNRVSLRKIAWALLFLLPIDRVGGVSASAEVRLSPLDFKLLTIRPDSIQKWMDPKLGGMFNVAHTLDAAEINLLKEMGHSLDSFKLMTFDSQYSLVLAANARIESDVHAHMARSLDDIPLLNEVRREESLPTVVAVRTAMLDMKLKEFRPALSQPEWIAASAVKDRAESLVVKINRQLMKDAASIVQVLLHQ